MKKIILFVIFLNIAASAQSKNNNINLFSPSNIKSFADYLFCQHDYLRAVEQYNRYLKIEDNDTVKYKIGISLMRMKYYHDAANSFQNIFSSPVFGNYARLNYLRAEFLSDNFKNYRNSFNQLKNGLDKNIKSNALSLYHFSYFFSNKKMPEEAEFLKPFDESDKGSIRHFYMEKTEPDYKSPVKAAILSGIIPGAGKFYTHNYADGITAFLTCGILSYIAYTDFRAHHKFRAWLFTGLTAGFYAGNIYGAAASAQIFNAKIKFDFTKSLKNYLEKVNYFIPVIKFCK